MPCSTRGHTSGSPPPPSRLLFPFFETHITPLASRLGDKSQVEGAAELCTCVFEGNLPLLRRLITAGIHVDSADYDKRTALHISAAEGNLQAVGAACLSVCSPAGCLLCGARPA